MTLLKPDPTFYPSPRMAMKAPAEKIAYVAMINPNDDGKPDAIGTVDVDPESSTYGRLLSRTDLTGSADELHHFGWNACSSCLAPWAPHPHMERRYLIVPGINSSRIHVLDTGDDPKDPKIVKVIEPETLAERAGYSGPHTVHCGPDGIYISALGNEEGDSPGGLFVMDAETFDIRGAWEIERGSQELMYDFWWHLGYDTIVTSTWGTPNMVKGGLDPDLLLNSKYGHSMHVWDLKRRRHLQELELGPEHQMALELRPAHDPRKPYGFLCSVVSLKDLSASIWIWYLDKGNNGADEKWAIKKVIEIPAEPADADDLPPMLKGFGAVPPLLTDINLSVDDRFLYASCWGTGEFIQYDVSDPMNPRKTDSVRIGGIVGRVAHPSNPGKALNGGPQMVEVSRDGKRVYFTNSLYTSWDAQFYPDGIESWMVKLDVDADGGMAFDERFFLEFDMHRSHQVRLQGGDASSDSYCFS